MDEGLQAQIGPPIEPDYLRPVYANQANVNFTPHDFRFMFSVLVAPLEFPAEAVESGKMEIRPQAVAHVLVPATMMHALIGLLQAQFSAYLTQFGPSGFDPAGPGGPR